MLGPSDESVFSVCGRYISKSEVLLIKLLPLGCCRVVVFSECGHIVLSVISSTSYKLVSGDDVPEMPAVAAEKTVSIYPNPVVNQATVQFDAEGTANVSYQVYDLMGRLVMNQNLGRLAEGMQEIEINMSNLSTGSYILRVSEGVRTATAKFLVY